MTVLRFILHAILRILITIGDGVQWIFRCVFSFLRLTYNLSHSVLMRLVKFIQLNFNLNVFTLKHRKPGRPPKHGEIFRYWTFSLSLQKLTKKFHQLSLFYRDAFIDALKFFIPQIPKIGFPHISFPQIKYPQVNLPINIYNLIRKTLNPPPTPEHPLTIYPIPLQISWQIKSFFGGVFLTIVFIFIPSFSYQWLRTLPNPQLLSRRDLEVSTKIFDRKGKLLYEIYTDQNRTPITLKDIPLIVQQATIAIEDREFYSHQGFSVKGILRATKETLLNHRVQGGSTITQQLIKSALLSPEVTLSRKVKEIILAFWAEQMFTKKQILEMYLNQVPYGGTAWGIESASQTYFGKSVKDLSLAEATLLAGLPAAPSQYSPFGSAPQLAFQRQKEVLRRMVEDHYITQSEADSAISQKIVFTSPHIGIQAPHFVMYVKDILEKRYGTRLVERGGLRVITSLDLDLQKKAETIVANQIQSLASLSVGNGAATITNPKTGEILAMVGSRNYFDMEHDGNVNVTTSLRQPGSSIKVVNYTAALENGFTAASPLDDSPIAYSVVGSPTYAPVNYDGRYHGITPLRYALGNSYNITAVKVLAKIGLKTMIEKGKQMGITTWNDDNRFGLSLTLGGGEVTMLDMTKVFGTLANGGKRMDLLPILEVSDYTGNVLEKNTPANGIQATSTEVAWIMSNILSDNQARTAAFGPNSSLVIPGKTVSVKTGTTDSKRDNWTIGFTPSYLTAVWVGNNDNSPMNPALTSGITGAAPIWHDIMTEILKDIPDEVTPQPYNVISIPCYFNRSEYFIRGTEPAGGKCVTLPTPSPTPTP
jgi:1A family penicillin-binding protein